MSSKKKQSGKKKYVFDLDGTLCTINNGGNLDYKNAKPLKARIAAVNDLYNNGHYILIDTARGSESGIDWRMLTINQLDAWGLKYHELRTGVKISGDVYIDDKGVSDSIFFNQSISRIEEAPVVPIPVAFSNGSIFTSNIAKYVSWLEKHGTNTIMTTAGTSQFNLLNKREIRLLNKTCILNFSKNKIIGIQSGSLNDTVEEVRLYNRLYDELGNISLLILYPDRYYSNDHIINFFHTVSNASNFPIFIHGLSMKCGAGGMYDYKHDLVNSIRLNANIVGMKEECSSFELGYDLCRKTKGFIKIVAGKSARRFALLHKAGAQTYLAGLGNLFPEIENNLYDEIVNNKDGNLLSKFEDPFFDVFMKIGWHKALRGGIELLRICDMGSRDPLPRCNNSEKESIARILNYIKTIK